MLVRGVIEDELGQDADVARVRIIEQPFEVVERSVDRIDGRVVGDVIAVVAQR
jgi:hypothetical protein